jgi:hypothetical protein
MLLLFLFQGKVSSAWFYMHIGCQLLAVAAAVAGFVVALLAFGWKDYPGNTLYRAHKWMGIGILGMAVLQVGDWGSDMGH